MPPKVSICIPTYKQVKYLQKTLDSIVKQDYNDFELIITDDTPNDSVKQLIDKYDFKGKLKYYKNKASLGSPENWNECIGKCSGDFVKIMHHDDWFSESYSLRKFVEAMDHAPNIGFAFSRVRSINASRNTEEEHVVSKSFLESMKKDPTVLFSANLIGSPSVTMFRRSIDVRFDKNLKWVVDIDFYIQYLLKNDNFIFLDEVLVVSVNNAEHSVTNECINKEIEIFEYIYLYKKISGGDGLNKTYVDFFRDLFKRYNVNRKELNSLMKGMKFDTNICLALVKKKIGL